MGTTLNETLRDGLALVSRAADYAARRHVNQRRKGAKQEPYVNHLAEVAHLLAQTLEEPNPQLLAAAWLHDVLEDACPTREEYERTKAEIEKQFGPAVLQVVLEVTDDKSLPKAERKRLQIESTAGKSREARLLKLADKTSNVFAVALSPPVDWDTARIADYVRWAEEVVASCRGLNAELEKSFDMAVAAARAKFLAMAPRCVPATGQPRCCSAMAAALAFACDQHEDPFDCPDALIVYNERFDEFGIPIHDGGTSFVQIQHCPWCGTLLPNSQRYRWFDALEARGIDPADADGIPPEFQSAAWRTRRASGITET